MANHLANPLPLKIAPFSNPSGALVFRVTGSIRRERVRKNFKTEDLAQTFVNEQLAVRERIIPPRPVITRLSERQVRDAEAAFLSLPEGTTMRSAADFFAEHHRPLTILPLPEAIKKFIYWLDKQRKCELVTTLQRESVLKNFARTSRVEKSDGITLERARRWIAGTGTGDRTQRDRFDLLNYFCGWLVKNKHAAWNPVPELDRPVHKARVPGVLTFDEVWQLLQCALTDAEGPDMLPFFALCALSGLRPDEVPRLSDGALDASGRPNPNPWADFYLEDEHRLIEVNKAKGGRKRRNATICDPLWRILTWCKARQLSPVYFSRRKFRRIRIRAGLGAKWQKDLLRHTYASHHYVLTKDVRELEKNMGNSERVLFQSYLRPVPLLDGLKYAGLCLHYSAPRETSAMGTGPKPRKAKAPPPVEAAP